MIQLELDLGSSISDLCVHSSRQLTRQAKVLLTRVQSLSLTDPKRANLSALINDLLARLDTVMRTWMAAVAWRDSMSIDARLDRGIVL